MSWLKRRTPRFHERSRAATIALLGPPLLLASMLYGAASADELTLSAYVPEPPGSGSYAVQTQIPGFNPAWGTLYQVDVCLMLGYSRTAQGMAVMIDPFVVGAPVGYTVSVGMGATLGQYDATGFVGFQGVSDASTFTGTAFSWGPAVTFDVAGTATNCVTYTEPAKMHRFLSDSVTWWYVAANGVFESQFVSPQDAHFMEMGTSTVHDWTVRIDVTCHFTPAGVTVEASPWGSVKSLFR